MRAKKACIYAHSDQGLSHARLKVIYFSCSTQLSMKFSLLINMKMPILVNMKMPTIVGIFIFISREISCSAKFSKKEFAIVSNLRFISRTNFMLS